MIVSDERDDRMTAESVRPSNEKRHTTANSDEIAGKIVGRV